jgi:hypothetical protein
MGSVGVAHPASDSPAGNCSRPRPGLGCRSMASSLLGGAAEDISFRSSGQGL